MWRRTFRTAAASDLVSESDLADGHRHPRVSGWSKRKAILWAECAGTMLRRIGIILCVSTFLCAVTLAQERPDFTGTWGFNQQKSTPGIAGNTPNIAFASRIVVRQSADEFDVTLTSVRQQPVAAVYRLDGSQVNVQAPAGITEVGSARIEGSTLVITSRRSFTSPAGETVVQFKEVWSVAGQVLTIEKTRIEDGESSTEKAVYDRM